MRTRAGVIVKAGLLIVALLFMLLGIAGGCGASGTAGATTTVPAATSLEAPSTSVTAAAPAADATVALTDQAGRTVVIPASIKTVYCTSPMGTNLMYMLAPEMLVGWNITPTSLEKEYIPEKYRTVVGLGGWFGKNTTGNVEEIIKRDPDVILDLGTLDEGAVSQADRIQDLVKIPVIMVDGSLVKSGDALRYIGKLVGAESRAQELAAYCDEVIQEAQANSAKLSESQQRVRVYYAEGAKGLNTDPMGSSHTEVLDLVGGENVAQVELDPAGYGMSPVSFEQVLLWDPEVILVASDPAEESNVYQQITTGADWSQIAAVKTNDVYQIPRGPFDWFDRPPSISRILGVRWLGNLLYPDLYSYDMETEVRAFYELFYHIDLTDEQFQKLTSRAMRDN